LSMLKSLASSSSTMFLHAKNSATSLTNVWPELGGKRGLRSTCRCVHAMVVDSPTLFECSLIH
jgi:hypothetical protein